MTEHRIFALTLIALATLAGCSSQPAKNALLDQARSDYQTAQNTPQARDFAGGEMKQADDALKLANAASERGDKPADVDKVIQSDTEFGLVLYRTQLFNPDDLDNVKKIQAGYKAQPLSAFLGQPAPPAPKVSRLA